MKFQFVAVLEHFVDNQGILADDLVRLKPEQPLLNRECVRTNALPPVLEIFEVTCNGWFARPLGGDHDGCLVVRTLVVLLHVSKKEFSKDRRHVFRQ